MKIVVAQNHEQWQQMQALITEYAQVLGFSLEFQNLSSELENLPTVYGPPGGRALLAVCEGQVCGCVALRPLKPGVCEMKRLYVRPACRGQHLGRQLADKILQEARELGYASMRLDTVESLVPALNLYRSMGFYDIPPYNTNPRPDVRHMERPV